MSLSYLIVVTELLLPLLFVHYYHRAVRCWHAAAAAAGRGSGDHGQAGGSGGGSQAGSPGGGQAEGGEGAGELTAAASRPGSGSQGSGAGLGHLWRRGRRPAVVWSPGMVSLLFVGVCGVLWDVAITHWLRSRR